MRLGIISDTHGHVANTRDAVERLAEWSVREVIHCGDIGSEAIIPMFAKWPTHFVFGNVDRAEGKLRSAIEAAGQTCHGEWGQLEIDGQRIGFLHGHDPHRFSEMVESGDWDVVCYGHTHQPDWREIGATRVLNPGAVYRSRPHSVAVLELPELTRHSLTF